MIKSMTAFSREEKTDHWGTAIWEVRSVNFRYLDVTTRLPEELRALEPVIRERVSRALSRGKVDCTLKFHSNREGGQDFQLNLELVDQLARASRLVDERLGTDTALRSLDILRWPGVIDADSHDLDVVNKEVLLTARYDFGKYGSHACPRG